MSLSFHPHHRFERQTGEGPLVLETRVAQGSPANLSFVISASKAENLVIEVPLSQQLPAEVYLVQRQELPGVGFFQDAEPLLCGEKLLKTRLTSVSDGWQWRRSRFWRRAKPYYQPPEIRLEGPVELALKPQQQELIWLKVRTDVNQAPGSYDQKLLVRTQDDTRELSYRVRVLPFALEPSPRDLMIWTRFTLDQRGGAALSKASPSFDASWLRFGLPASPALVLEKVTPALPNGSWISPTRLVSKTG